MPFLGAGPPEKTRSPILVSLGRAVSGVGLSLPSLQRARATVWDGEEGTELTLLSTRAFCLQGVEVPSEEVEV